MSKQGLVLASCSLGILFLCGFSGFEPTCLAQSSLAPVPLSVAKDEEAKRCLESTCRNAPLREKLTVIPLGTKYVRGIIGGFEQGAGIGGGAQLTSVDTIPSLELRATMSLGRLWHHQGRRSAARALVAEVYDWFSEGLETTALAEAKALLDRP